MSSRELALRGRAVEAADPHVDRVDLATADQRHQVVARALQRQPALDRLWGVARELDGAVVPEEVGRMEHVDVEGVALDPLAAVEEPPEQPDRLGNLDAAEALEGVDRTRLVGDGADAADAGGDVRGLPERAALEERLEESRRLEDAQLDVLDAPIGEAHRHAALAFHAREVVGDDRPPSRHARPPHGTPRRSR